MAQPKTESLPLRTKDERSGGPATKRFGRELKAEFPFDPDWTNLNHGSFGTIPTAIQSKFHEYNKRCEARPDGFIRYEYPGLLDESRAAVAKLVNAPIETVVLLTNATDGVNTVFRNMVWNEDGKDVILTFSTIYESCGKAADYLVDYFGGKVSTAEIDIEYPIEDDEILRRFRKTVADLEASGKRARVVVIDVVSSRPGVRFPWEDTVKACKELGVVSLVDGAQGLGMVELDLPAVDPDFFVSNAHKWLHVPRGCAVFYTPLRNQHLLPSALATSHGYRPKGGKKRTTPLPPTAKSDFVHTFEFVGTKDNAPYCTVKDSITWRRDVLGGEAKILAYLWDLNKKGIGLVAESLGTETLDNSAGTMTNCAMGNVALPVWKGQKGAKAKEGDAVVPDDEADPAQQWISETLVSEYKTFMPPYWMGGRLWVRISAQVYLDLADYEFAAKVLKELAERVGKKEYLKK